jgi:hypothetical protein
MLLPPRVTEERKRISSVTTYRVSHVDIRRAVNDGSLPIAEQFTTTLRADVGCCRPNRPTRSWLPDGGV